MNTNVPVLSVGNPSQSALATSQPTSISMKNHLAPPNPLADAARRSNLLKAREALARKKLAQRERESAEISLEPILATNEVQDFAQPMIPPTKKRQVRYEEPLDIYGEPDEGDFYHRDKRVKSYDREGAGGDKKEGSWFTPILSSIAAPLFAAAFLTVLKCISEPPTIVNSNAKELFTPTDMYKQGSKEHSPGFSSSSGIYRV